MADSLDQDLYSVRAELLEGPESLRARLEQASGWYAAFLAPWLPRSLDALLLDVPCGAGNLLYALRRLGFTRVRGIDSDPKQVAVARELGLPAEVGDAFASVEAAPDASLDAIFSLDFLEHLEPVEAARFCRAAHRALRPGGRLVCRTPSADGPFGSHDRCNDVTHKWGLTSTAARPFLMTAGFAKDGIEVRDEAPVPYKWQNVVRRGLFVVTTRAVGAWLDLCGIGKPAIWTRSMWLIGTKRAP